MLEDINNEAAYPSVGSRRSLLSLWDIMQRFKAMNFTKIIASLERATSAIYVDSVMSAERGVRVWKAATDTARSAITDVNQAIADAPISNTIKLEAGRLLERVSGLALDNDTYRAVVQSGIDNLKFNVVNEMSRHLFLLVPDDLRALYDQDSPILGDAVAARFGDASRDIAAAGRCLALDEWTAAVFHLMRVLEHGLRDLASKVNATFANGVDHENWKNIIDVIEKKIREMEALPKGPQKSADLEFYSKAASQFWHFKEAWRNHVSHSRATYDKTEAMQVFNAVYRFMQQLAERP